MTDWVTRLEEAAWRRWRLGLLGLGLVSLLVGSTHADIIDRVVAVVDQQAITASEVEQQLRMEALFNHEPVEITAEQRSRALQRLIAGRLIQGEALMAGFLKTNEEEVQRRLSQSKQDIYINGLGFTQALEFYDLREQDVAAFWRQVIGYERFKDFRFKTGLELSLEEVTAYYESQVVPELKAQGNTNPPPLGEIYDRVEEAAIEDRANQLLEEWLRETRPQTRIVILEERESPPNDAAAPDGSAAAPDGSAAEAPVTTP